MPGATRLRHDADPGQALIRGAMEKETRRGVGTQVDEFSEGRMDETMTEIESIKKRIEELERHVGINPASWATVYTPPARKRKKKPIPQEEPAELESHPTHNWKPGNKGPQDEV